MTMPRTSNAYFWKFGGAVAKQFIAFAFSIVLARNLLPADFGVIAAALAMIQLAKVLINIGLGEALIQNQNNNQSTYSSVFTVNLFVGLVLFMLFFASAPWLADFFEDERLILIIRILGFIVLFDSLSVVQISILSKNLEFEKIVKRRLLTQTLAGFLAIGSLYLGFDIYALVVQNVAISLFNTALLWKISNWRPSFKFDKAELLKLYEYTKYSFLTILVSSALRNLVPMVVAKSFSSATLGFYRRSDSLVKLIVNTINESVRQVLFASLSRIQNDLKSSLRVFEISLELVVVLSVFTSGLVFLGAELFFLEILGPQWAESLNIFKILVVLGFFEPFQLVINSAILSKGLSKMNFYSQSIRRASDLIGLGVGLVFGFIPFLYAIVVSSIIGAVIYARVGNKVFDNAVSRVMLRSSGSIGFMLIVVFALEQFLSFENIWLSAGLKMLILTIAFATVFYVLRKEFIVSILKLIRA